MLSVHQLTKSYGAETVLKSVSFHISSGERLGLVGPNGCGKTTLLRILMGQEQPDSGGFRLASPRLRVGYLPQGYDPSQERPDEPETLQSYLARKQPDLEALSQQLEQLSNALALEPSSSPLEREYDVVLSALQSAAERSGETATVLAALGLDRLNPQMPVAHLSGGQKTRLALAGVLLSDPQLLLLDEPTNHLDIDMLSWLEEWLAAIPAAALIVSHDRVFLDRAVTAILEMDGSTHTLKPYPGNYSDYLEAKLAERERTWQEYSDQQVEIERLQAASAHLRGIAKFRKGGKADTADKFARGFFANRGKATVGRAKQIERKLERLLTEERVEKPRSSWQMKLEFGDTLLSGKDVLTLTDLYIGYANNTLLTNLSLQVRQGARIALIGPNGSGKTTLLRTLAGRIPPLSGSFRLGANVQLGYMAQEGESVRPELNPLESVRSLVPWAETEARSFLHKYLFSGEDVFTPNAKLSYGERARLTLALLVAQGANFLLLDEPINHLDIPSRARFEAALAEFHGTILAVVHDRFFIQSFSTQTWEVTGTSLTVELLE